ncbi:MAG TPA: family 43 glycosylhydrolase [Steroidobacter sp.]|uniref:glycoside hydrolase family 43 protein n=1 Tax=Steroidobacter sp. TaxID=1978227 RepID=UPI002ED77C8E
MKPIAFALAGALALATAFVTTASAADPPPIYRNPVLHSDYSDPDVIRVDDRYYMVASTFHFSPGLPVLKSRDLVHWTLIGHVLSRLDFHLSYDLPGPVEFDDTTERVPFNTKMGHRYAAGVWAPSIRFHNGRFYVYFATPTEGVFMASAARAEGPWSAPVKVIDEPNLEDPCPLWDDDGNAYLIHSRVGAGPLILRKMTADGTKVLDAGKVIVEDRQRLPILEGPKLLKRDGYYYIFAPYGGVGEGPQAVMRSRNIYGPYDFRTVLSKGTTHVQAPHQGGYVETPSGQGWFLHFNSTGAYGRIVHMQPVRWEDGWPVMGELLPGAPHGQPVLSHPVPDLGGKFDPVSIQTSDEFDRSSLGVQWEWNHNPANTHWSLSERRGFLRLKALPAPNFVSAKNTLTQVLHGRSSQITTRIVVKEMRDGQKAGLAMFGKRPSWIGLTQQSGQRRLTFSYAGADTPGDVIAGESLLLRVNVDDEFARYSYSVDEGKTFKPFGSRAKLMFSWWKGARPALFTYTSNSGGIADFDWVHVEDTSIDRQALVKRHNPTLTRIDPSSPLMVGNGNIAFTADITGLQTFQEQYSPLSPLLTQAQWAWHSFPNPKGFKYEDSLVAVDVRGQPQQYPWLKDWSEAKRPEIQWLRENPHRFSLGRLSLHLLSRDGKPAKFADLKQTRQTLDLWGGTLRSRFEFEGQPIKVETSVHPRLDLLLVRIDAPTIEGSRLGIDLKFPGVAAQLNPNPADWQHPERHVTQVLARSTRQLSLERRLDDTRYFVEAASDEDVTFDSIAPHTIRVLPKDGDGAFTFSVLFSPERHPQALPLAATTRTAVATQWDSHWNNGGVIDFSGSTDPRAKELERRVVLSQYLMALNAAGTLPPQEEGLFSNSWNGKFHLEMHPWHAAHFALWGRTELLERSMPWYQQHLPQAKARAASHGVTGAWWPKMVGPDGRESPSTITPFLMWQQPHPIFLAELIYRDRPNPVTLAQYRELVFETAELLASFAHYDEKGDRYVLGPPLIPAQEVFPPLSTFNPTFELEYFRFGLATAQAWRERLKMPRKTEWDRVLQKLSPLPQREGLYLAVESFPQQWEQARSPVCSNGKTAEQCWNRDHPSFVGALGLLPGAGVDRETMRRTLRAVESHWDMRQTWGWDFPLLAMTAARLHEPDKAVDYLLHASRNFQFGVSGMTPRVHLNEHAADLVPSNATNGNADAGYRRLAETYFPSNGGLLLAIGLMAAGWDGELAHLPGFPKEGWKVRAEGLRPLP